MSNVNIRNLCVHFGKSEVIQNLNLEVQEGEFLVLLGPSGCGKSTLLHSIAGLLDVSDGTIEIGGQDMTWADPTDRNIGMVFQSYALYPTMTVERNMSFGLRIKGLARADIDRRIERVATMLQLTPLLGRKPAQLSGGQRQRVAIGRALVREAGVFLFDEPLSNLDAKLRAELRRELKLLHKQLGSTMIYVTHDQVEAMTLATRVVVMRAGKVQQIGAPTTVYERPDNLFVAGFLGSPAINLLHGQIDLDAGAVFRSGNFALDLGSYAFKHAPHRGQAVVLGLRPEHVQIGAHGVFQGQISLVEPMGNHQIVWVDFNGTLLSAIVFEAADWKPDQTVRFALDTARISLFDPASEQRL